MQTTIPTLGTISRGRRLMPTAVAWALGLLLVFGLAQSGFAQSDPPLTFGNNFLVTGDFVVAGANGLNVNVANGFATGTIQIPDANPGIQPGSTSTCIINGVTHTNCVPAGAEIVAALLYWQTVVKITTPTDPALDPAANGFFRPLFPGGPQTGYAIRGANLVSQQTTVSFSNGGCTGSSTGKVVRTYRADVRAGLPQDATGNPIANGTYEVKLASTGSTTPITLGATLVIIYRIQSPDVPLNSIVIYEGAFAPGNSTVPLLTMTQTVQGFYDASTNPVSRLGHIVGQGKSNKFQTVSLDGVPLPSLYGSGQPAFPGFYGGWDNPVWTFPEPAIGNPVLEDAASATTMVVPSTSQQGCVSWGAVIFSTTVKNTAQDGLLDVWKKPLSPKDPSRPGYCDASVNEGVCNQGDPSWVDLPGAKPGKQDVFVQLDYMCSRVTGTLSCDTTNGNYSFDPRLPLDPLDVDPQHPNGKSPIDKVIAAFANPNHPVNLHVIPTHAIQEETCQDFPGPPLVLCPFPNQPGVVGWPGGIIFLENQLIDTTSGNLCLTTPPAATCVPVFQHGAQHSVHHVVVAHALGLPNWTLQAGTLANVDPKSPGPNVMQAGTTVMFKTSTPHGLKGNVNDRFCAQGRVTVAYAITNPNLNGTYCVQVTGQTTFTIQVANSTNFTYTSSTDPNFAVVSGQAGTISGFSDIGGQRSAITVASWGDDGKTWQVKAGTIMHELGHQLGATHSGYSRNNLNQNPRDYTPTIGPNCNPGFQSVMSYSHQVDLLDKRTGFVDQNGNPVLVSVVDYSEQALDTLNKGVAASSNPFSAYPTYFSTSWFVPWPVLFDSNGKPIGSPAKQLCDGRPIPVGATPMTFVTGPTASLSWSAGQDINFDGNTAESLRGHNDWIGTPESPALDFRQTSAAGVLSAPGAGGFLGGGGGGGGFLGGGGGLGELTRATANSVTRPPRFLTASEGASPRTITLNWTAPTFGQIGFYNVYRSENGGPFTIINFLSTNPPHTVAGNPPATTFTDTVTCDPGGFRYLVTAVLSDTSTNPGQESVPSNTVPASGQPKLTGCYALTGGNANLQVTGFSTPAAGATFIQGDTVSVTGTVNDDFYATNGVVPNASPATLIAIGPLLHDGACPSLASVPVFLTNPGNYPPGTFAILSPGLTVTNSQFTFNWITKPFLAGCWVIEADFDSGQVERTEVQLDIFVSDSAPYMTTTTLPDGVVGSAYSNTLQEAGGVGPFMWAVVSGALPNGIMLNSASGTLSGTPTAPGIYKFTVQITDSVGNFSQPTQLTLRVADALFGDLVVVDGSPSANPLSGTLLRISPTGTTGTIAAITTGSPTGVAVDATTGNIYAAVAPVGLNGTPGVTQVTRFGTVNNFVSGGVLQSPVAVAVDSAGNVYVGDNKADKIYKYNSAGTQVNANGTATANPFASLPASPNDLQDIRMTFDSAGNLIVASDGIGDAIGQVEVDKIDATGAVTSLYNTTTNAALNATLTYSLTAASAASGGNTTYTGTFSPILSTGSAVTISGFTNGGNNGAFSVVSCTSTTLVVNNPNGVAETNPGTATVQRPIGTVGGIAVFADGSIDVADFSAQAIFKITSPGAAGMAIMTAIGPTAALCCNLSGMANPPSQVNTTLYATVNFVTRLQLAVPETSSVTTVLSGAPLTFPNDVAWYDFKP